MLALRRCGVHCFLVPRRNLSVKAYQLSAVGSGAGCKSLTDTGHQLATDLPISTGGHNTAPQPVELFLAALVGCKTATATFVARHMKPRVNFSRIEFNLTAHRDQKGAISLPLSHPLLSVGSDHGQIGLPPSRLQSISGTARVFAAPDCDSASKVAAPTEEQVRELGQHVHHRCPLANMAHLSGCHVDICWELAEQ